MTQTKAKRGPGRPKGSKNKSKSNTEVVKRGRGRPKGSKNKITVDEGFYNLPFPNPKHEDQRIENIRHMVSFYQNPDGTPKIMLSTPKKRGRKSELENLDAEKLLKQDLDSDKLVYGESDIQDELSRMDAYRDMSVNSSRYSDDF
tara:strand:+ start:227 stop:661 length:435 start_codon:yes stop_codon:yes gene_type:complete